MNQQKHDELDFLNWEAPEEQIETPSLPYIQWFNGQGKAFAKLNPVLASGGWELPQDVWGAYLGDTFELIEVPHGNNSVVNAYLLPLLHISVINTRFVWQLYDNGQTVYSKEYVQNATGRLNVFAMVKELGNFPVMLTLKGMVGKAFSGTRKQHLNTVIKAATMVGKANGYPQYMFWMPVMAGESQMVGQAAQSAITPPVAAWDVGGLNDKATMSVILKDLYIGQELRDLITGDLFAQSELWKTEHEQKDTEPPKAEAETNEDWSFDDNRPHEDERQPIDIDDI